jgi:hypothetical protein
VECSQTSLAIPTKGHQATGNSGLCRFAGQATLSSTAKILANSLDDSGAAAIWNLRSLGKLLSSTRHGEAQLIKLTCS